MLGNDAMITGWWRSHREHRSHCEICQGNCPNNLSDYLMLPIGHCNLSRYGSVTRKRRRKHRSDRHLPWKTTNTAKSLKVSNKLKKQIEKHLVTWRPQYKCLFYNRKNLIERYRTIRESSLLMRFIPDHCFDPFLRAIFPSATGVSDESSAAPLSSLVVKCLSYFLIIDRHLNDLGAGLSIADCMLYMPRVI